MSEGHIGHGEGSSPLTRGKRTHVLRGQHYRGLIPAHAGKTDDHHRGRYYPRAHPRSRGENRAYRRCRWRRRGSSPLTRGKLQERRVLRQRARLIPAHAGKTGGDASRGTRVWAHPRSRGENFPSLVDAQPRWGSSPLTRGKLQERRVLRQRARLIPAHAGKTGGDASRGTRVWAHPRSRGENFPSLVDAQPRWGSSPLTRGKPRLRRPRRWTHGLIPAHAGKTQCGCVVLRLSRAHPRSRGENHTGRWAGRGLQGSSPLTRGKHRVLLGDLEDAGLIPAHAGKTPWQAGRRECDRAHPRSRGENRQGMALTAHKKGSSPLTRGKLAPARSVQALIRLIPAHAGKTPSRDSESPTNTAHPRSRGENTS